MDYSNLTVVRPPEISSIWMFKDRLGALRVRFSLGRNRYRVNPGLYRLGKPGKDSEVIVTANYKLSFDLVRKSLSGLNVWVLVLETYGINVWCAAGKGTFGTDELIRQVKESRLSLYVSHRRLIVPQLGAPGVSAHKVKEASGFSVKFGPVRADDIKEYFADRYKKSEVARSVQFKLRDRFILTAVELANSLRYLFVAIIFLILLSGINSEGYSFSLMWKEGIKASLYLLAFPAFWRERTGGRACSFWDNCPLWPHGFKHPIHAWLVPYFRCHFVIPYHEFYWSKYLYLTKRGQERDGDLCTRPDRIFPCWPGIIYHFKIDLVWILRDI